MIIDAKLTCRSSKKAKKNLWNTKFSLVSVFVKKNWSSPKDPTNKFERIGNSSKNKFVRMTILLKLIRIRRRIPGD